ncbi:twin-arginine translocation pathway signal [Oceanicola sp. 22II-s10i]|uniref:DUF1513 domain-containing protein n=1 Tax=Oceanicola sp. 22II-s10i TaxID=1317116 RepID=UPI000B51F05E|nr:DUF1513 domain-containing protein [Oceanicola sp. 22II-s10i]OWU84603.1 twin-arginine translocation pathway signal [Oceanicola sp. 22II-s10i]
MTTRRAFLASLAAATAAPRLGWAAAGSPDWLGAAKEPDGSYGLHGIRTDGSVAFSIPLPARGHAGAAHPKRAEAVAFARRPGHYALVIDCLTGVVARELTPPEGHQFNGHGAYSQDGRWLFTSEQMAADSAGRVGVWDVGAGYRRVRDVATGGIGPHELRLMPDGETLVVANGGIATDPEDRTKLNIETMAPSLVYLSTDGALLEQVVLEPDLSQNSIRHLAVRGDGLVAFAMQWEGGAGAATPLLGLHRQGGAVVLAEAPLAEQMLMKGYAGSVALSGSGREVAITSPKGGRLHRFAVDGTFLGAMARADVCGLATHPAGYLASDGLGGLLTVDADGARPLARGEMAWDNHLVALG